MDSALLGHVPHHIPDASNLLPKGHGFSAMAASSIPTSPVHTHTTLYPTPMLLAQEILQLSSDPLRRPIISSFEFSNSLLRPRVPLGGTYKSFLWLRGCRITLFLEVIGVGSWAVTLLLVHRPSAFLLSPLPGGVWKCQHSWEQHRATHAGQNLW